MDRERFDGLVRLLAQRGSRRGALASLLSVALLGARPETLAKPRTGKRRGKRQRQGRRVRAEVVSTCFPGSPCMPGPGARLVQCDFGGTSVLAGQNLQGAQLALANLRGADATGADFTNAQLGGACLAGANLTGATVSQAQLRTTLRCQTTLPNGALDNTDCNNPTPCCPTACLNDAHCPPGQFCCNNTCQTDPCCTPTGSPCEPSNSGACCSQCCRCSIRFPICTCC